MSFVTHLPTISVPICWSQLNLKFEGNRKYKVEDNNTCHTILRFVKYDDSFLNKINSSFMCDMIHVVNTEPDIRCYLLIYISKMATTGRRHFSYDKHSIYHF